MSFGVYLFAPIFSEIKQNRGLVEMAKRNGDIQCFLSTYFSLPKMETCLYQRFVALRSDFPDLTNPLLMRLSGVEAKYRYKTRNEISAVIKSFMNSILQDKTAIIYEGIVGNFEIMLHKYIRLMKKSKVICRNPKNYKLLCSF